MERLEESSDVSILTEHDIDSMNNSLADNEIYIKNALKSNNTIEKLARRKCKPQKKLSVTPLTHNRQ